MTAQQVTPNLPNAKGPVAPPANPMLVTMRIKIEENSDIPPTGLFIGHNGRSFMLQPGRWLDAPVPLLDILDNAVTSEPILDPNTRQTVGWRSKLRYPYQIAPGQTDPRHVREEAA